MDWKLGQRFGDFFVAIVGLCERHNGRSEEELFNLAKIMFPKIMFPESQRISDILSKALSGQDPSDWKEARKVLDDYSAAGVSPVSHPVIDTDGTLKTWLLYGVDDGIAGHLEDGSESFFWSEERGLRWWDQERIPATV